MKNRAYSKRGAEVLIDNRLKYITIYYKHY